MMKRNVFIIKTVQAWAPTSDPSDDEAEVFYEEMEQTPVTVIPIHNVHVVSTSA